MNVNHKLLDTLHKLGSGKQTVERLYSRMLDEQLFIAAYTKLYSNKGAMTVGVSPKDTIDGMSLERIRQIIQTLRDGNWQWKPVRRIHISKGKGKTRALGIPSWSDKLVQEVMRMVLEAYYEPIFVEESHGFRPQRSCHTALSSIKKTWTGTVWFIEGDIKGCFDNIDHDILLEIIGKQIRDFRFLRLIRTMLKAGYRENGAVKQSLSGTPQGGIVSPILANILLHELDEYIVNLLKPDFDKGKRKRTNPNYQKLTNAIYQAKQRNEIETARLLKNKRQEIPRSDPMDPDFRRLYYVRYADDFIVGIIGMKSEAIDIQTRVSDKLSELGLQMSYEKTVITNATHDKARFLGYEIYTARDLIHRHVNGRIQLSVPKDRIDKIMKRYTFKGKPVGRSKLFRASIEEIIHIFDVEFRGYYNYYRLAYNVSNRLNKLKYVMWYSLMRTLASKLNSSVSKLMKRYKVVGPKTGKKCVGVRIETDKGERLVTFGDLNVTVDWDWNKSSLDIDPFHPGLRQRELTFRIKHNHCELCGKETNQLEAHHIRRLKDIRRKVRKGTATRWQLTMVSRNRKTLVVCKDCHKSIHS